MPPSPSSLFNPVYARFFLAAVRIVSLLSALLAPSRSGLAQTAVVPPPISTEQIAFFETQIRPLLATHCLECHSAEKGKVKGRFSMDNREDLLKGGESGVVLKPGDVRGSALIEAVEWTGELQMPPKKKLSDEQIAALKLWVSMGVPDPRQPSAEPRLAKKEHWAFKPVARPALPAVTHASWCKNSIDRFILAKLESQDMLPSDPPETGAPAEIHLKKAALLRRAYFDLVGLPPSPREIQDFIQDTSVQGFEKIVDKLLASPAYGERWARHWLDTARYSDTTGNESLEKLEGEDYRLPYAWTYRDWVIRALNTDLPYNQFITQQIAADKVEGNNRENLAALGFITIGQRFRNEDEVINERIDAVTRGFLGLTVACARCHNHKFDPITQADYYGLHGVFKNITEPAEKPVLHQAAPGSTENREFEQAHMAWIANARRAVISMQEDFSKRFRSHPGAFFALAYLGSTREFREDKAKIDLSRSIYESHHIKPNDQFFIQARIAVNLHGPVLRPFYDLVIDSARKRPNAKNPGADEPPNPLVEGFISRQKEKPTDIIAVMQLVEKFFTEIVSPQISKELYARMLEPHSADADSPVRPLLQLAAFPLPLIDLNEINTETDVRATSRLIRTPAGDIGADFDTRAEMSKFSRLLMSSSGAPVKAMTIEDLPTIRDSPIYVRGNRPRTLAGIPLVPRKFIDILSPDSKGKPFTHGSGRMELAQAIADPANPLTARVAVNRVWMHHFGEGLVKTPDDLGIQAGDPTHPELLDFLASWFMQDYGPSKPAWSLKSLHKAIMLSATYQQSPRSPFMDLYSKKDPSNSLLWKSGVKRIDFEAFRDSLLSMSGLIEPKLYGPPVNITSEPYSHRRSIYGYIDRLAIPDLLLQNDVTAPLQVSSRRNNTIVPQQALFLMNSPFILETVQNIARRPEIVDPIVHRRDDRAGILAVFQVVLQRYPRPEEYEMAYLFLRESARTQSKTQEEAEKIVQLANKTAISGLNDKLKRMDTQSKIARRAELINEGQALTRVVMTPWEALIQSLLFTNEVAYTE